MVNRSRTMRAQPDKFVRSLIDNKLVDTEIGEDDDNVFSPVNEAGMDDLVGHLTLSRFAF